jgi:hypothetical protein
MTTWKPWTLEEIADWERQCLAGTLFTDAPAKSEYVAKRRCKPCAEAAAPYLASLGVSL